MPQGAVHPISGGAPDQKRCNAYGSGAPPQSTRTNAVSTGQSMPPPKQTARRPPPGRAESGNLQTRQSPAVWKVPGWHTADPGCGARGRRQGLAGLRDRSLRAEGSRVAISRAGRRPRVHQAAGPSKAGLSGTRKTAWAHSNKHSNKHNNGGASHRPAPPLRPLREEPRHTLTAWRPRS